MLMLTESVNLSLLKKKKEIQTFNMSSNFMKWIWSRSRSAWYPLTWSNHEPMYTGKKNHFDALKCRQIKGLFFSKHQRKKRFL